MGEPPSTADHNSSSDRATDHRIGDFADDARSLSLEEFRAKHGEAFLLHYGLLESLKTPLDMQTTLSPDQPKGQGDSSPIAKVEFLVFPVRSKIPSDEPDRIYWLGRTHNNEIVIPDASVSAVHAFIQHQVPDLYIVFDMGSMNGTSLDGQPVPTQGGGAAPVLSSGSRLKLGDVILTFLHTQEFIQLVKGLAG